MIKKTKLCIFYAEYQRFKLPNRTIYLKIVLKKVQFQFAFLVERQILKHFNFLLEKIQIFITFIFKITNVVV